MPYKIEMLLKTLIQFWLYHPALLYGISFLLGIWLYLDALLSLLLPLLCIWLPFFLNPYIDEKKTLNMLILSILIFVTGWFYAAAHYKIPVLPEEGIQGKAHVNIHSISRQQSFFGEKWVYRCHLTLFIPFDESQQVIRHLPCRIAIPIDKEGKTRPEANSDYWIDGKLMQKNQGEYVLKVSTKTSWNRIERTWNWAELRYEWKQLARQWIESRYSHAVSGSFLAGLATGEFDDSWMRMQFARFGLQHLLAISGFHFAIFAGFFSFILRFIKTASLKIIVLIIILSMYCFFLGPQASIMRAWVMCSLTAAGMLFNKQTTALNSLGFAILFLLTYNPLSAKELGFQLSFAATAAILLFYQPTSAWLSGIFPKRNMTEVIEMNGLNQHGYVILAFLRESFALSVAVNLFALPLTLFYFHQFPWMSLLYNLFYPLMASASLCLLLSGTLLFFIPPLAAVIHELNDRYTFFVLQLTYQIPNEMDTFLTTDPFPSAMLILYLTFVMLGGILWKAKFNHDDTKNFSFI